MNGPSVAATAIEAVPDSAIVLAQAEAGESAGIVQGVGTIVAVDPDTTKFGSATLTVDHDEIAGFMPPMEMMYSVSAAELLDGLAPGDRIGFIIDPVAMVINSIERLED